MTLDDTFAKRVQERFPEGLTGIISIGGTRTTYILRQRHQQDPGHIRETKDYADHLLGEYLKLADTFFQMGGQNVIMPVLSYQAFYERGEEYAQFISDQTIQLIGQDAITFYQKNNVDPYFIGIDTLLQLPQDHYAHQLATKLSTFQQEWSYQEGNKKIIWEVATIPLYSFWKAHREASNETVAAVERKLANSADMGELYRILYKYYSTAVYGTELPIPHFYIGSSRNGDFKLRSIAPIALLCGGPFRLFYTPYPTLFITPETLQTVIEEIAFGKTLSSTKMDYSGLYSPELVEAEYQRIMELSADPMSIMGLSRSVDSE